MQLDVERLQPAQRGEADAARRDGADIHAFEVVGAFDAIGDVPAASHHPPVGGDVVAHQRQDHHDDVLRHADGIAVRHLGDGDALVHRGLKIGVIRADAGGDDQLQLFRLLDPLLGHVSGPERLRDHDLGVGKLLVQHRILTVLARGHDQGVAGLLQEFAQAQLAGDAPQQLTRLEVYGRRRRRGLPVGIFGDLGDVVAGIGLRIAVDRIVIENTNHLGHDATPSCVDGRAHDIDLPALARAGRSTTCRHVAVALDQGFAWITHSASSSRFLMPAGAGCSRFFQAAGGRNLRPAPHARSSSHSVTVDRSGLLTRLTGQTQKWLKWLSRLCDTGE